MVETSTLAQIISEFGPDSEHPNTHPVSQETVRLWMQSDDIEALGAAYAFVTDPRHYARIRPPLSCADYYPFVMDYSERCLRENPSGDWADSRYIAGRQLATWFAEFWDDQSVPRSTVGEIKRRLAELYKAGDDELRTCIVNATLEHIFERRDLREFFGDWPSEADLRVAYEQAMEWNSR
jgi:hypothetical protein